MAFTHNTQRLPWKPRSEKPSFRASPLSFVSFIALYRMFTIQYKVFTDLRNPNYKFKIIKPWAKKPLVENRQKQPKKNLSEAPPPNPLNPYQKGSSQASCKEYNTYPTKTTSRRYIIILFMVNGNIDALFEASYNEVLRPLNRLCYLLNIYFMCYKF
jgi:hypothetical protein